MTLTPHKALGTECPYCEGMGSWYGVAPHKHDLKRTGSIIGSTVLLPKDQWPSTFREDSECPGLGTYTCEHCPPSA